MSSNLLTRRGPVWWIVTGIGLLVGCGDNLPERLDDVPMACAPTTAVYRIDHVDPSLAAAETLDLDGDGHADNALGYAHDFLTALEPDFAVGPRFAARLARLPWLVGVDRCGDEVRITIDQGVPLGDVPLLPHMLPRAVGTIAGTTIDATDGKVAIPLIALADAAQTREFPGWRDADRLAIHAQLADDQLTGVFAAALPTDAARADLAAPIAAFLTTRPAEDELRTICDADHDGVVTADELAATATYRTVTASDLTLDDQPASSIAFAFTATRLR
jgi:hypothetical protein